MGYRANRQVLVIVFFLFKKHIIEANQTYCSHLCMSGDKKKNKIRVSWYQLNNWGDNCEPSAGAEEFFFRSGPPGRSLQ